MQQLRIAQMNNIDHVLVFFFFYLVCAFLADRRRCLYGIDDIIHRLR